MTDTLTIPVSGDVYLATVIEGSGQLIVDGQSYSLSKGMSFVTPANAQEIDLSGSDLLLIASNPVVNKKGASTL